LPPIEPLGQIVEPPTSTFAPPAHRADLPSFSVENACRHLHTRLAPNRSRARVERPATPRIA
jgi:hypothetical protein